MMNCRALLTQLLVTFFGNVGPLALGLHIGWVAGLSTKLKSDFSPLGSSVTADGMGWLAALPTAGLLAGMPFYGFLMQKAPRKVALFFASVPHAAIFAGFATTHDLPTAYILRLLSGLISAGSLIVCPVYIAEITQDSLRGFMCCSSPFFINTGFAVSIALADYCSYFYYNIYCTILPLIFLAVFPFLPESPYRLMSCGKTTAAEKSLMFLRGGDMIAVEDELMKIEATLRVSVPKEGSGVMAALKDRAALKAIFITWVVLTLQQLCGSIPILTYLVDVVENVTSANKKYTIFITLIIMVMITIASAVGPFLLLILGRRSLLLLSTWAGNLSMAALTTMVYFFDKSIYTALPLAAFLAFYTLGLGNVPYVLLPELLPPNVRGIAAGILGLWMSILSFSAIKIFPYFSQYVGVTGYSLFFTVVTVVGTVLLHLIIFETKGLSSEDILKKLRGTKL